MPSLSWRSRGTTYSCKQSRWYFRMVPEYNNPRCSQLQDHILSGTKQPCMVYTRRLYCCCTLQVALCRYSFGNNFRAFRFFSCAVLLEIFPGNSREGRPRTMLFARLLAPLLLAVAVRGGYNTMTCRACVFLLLLFCCGVLVPCH